MAIAWVQAVFDTDMGPPAKKLMLLTLANHADKTGVCWPSLARLQQIVGLRDRHTRRLLRELEDSGFIETEERPGKSSVYTLQGVLVGLEEPRTPESGVADADPGHPRPGCEGSTPDTHVPPPRTPESGDPGHPRPDHYVEPSLNRQGTVSIAEGCASAPAPPACGSPVQPKDRCGSDSAIRATQTATVRKSRKVPPEGQGSIEDELAALAAKVPDSEWEKIPADATNDLDAYLYDQPDQPPGGQGSLLGDLDDSATPEPNEGEIVQPRPQGPAQRRTKKKATARKRKKPAKPRKPDPIWDAYVAEWMPNGVPTGQKKQVGGLVRDLKDMGATVKQIKDRSKALRADAEHKGYTLGIRTVVARWNILGVGEQAKAKRKRREDEEAEYQRSMGLSG